MTSFVSRSCSEEGNAAVFPKMISVRELRSVSTIEDVHEYLSKVEEAEREIDVRLAEDLSREVRNEYQEVVRTFLPSQLPSLSLELENAENALVRASELAAFLSARVQQLSSIRERVCHALKRMTQVIEVAKCVENAQFFLKQQDEERTADEFSKYLRYEESAIDERSRQTMDQVQTELLRRIDGELTRAIRAGDLSSVERYTRLFGLVEKPERAIEKLCDHVAAQVDVASTISEIESWQASHPGEVLNEAYSYAISIDLFFKRLHRQVRRQRDFLSRALGFGGYVRVLVSLEPIVAKYALELLQRFVESAGVLAMKQKVVSGKFAVDGESAESDSSLSSQLFSLVEYLVVVLQSFERHSRFLKSSVEQARGDVEEALRRAESVKEGGPDGPAPRRSAAGWGGAEGLRRERVQIDELAKKANFDGSESLLYWVSELAECYVLFEHYHLKEVMGMVVEQSGVILVEDLCQVSTMADNVFFLLKECMGRAGATLSVNILCAVTNLVVAELDGGFLTALEEISYLAPASSSAPGTGQGGQSAAMRSIPIRNVLISMNTIAQSARYVVELKRSIEEPCEGVFGRGSQELDKVMVCCEELVAVEGKIRRQLEVQMKWLMRPLSHKIAGMLEGFDRANFIVMDGQQAEGQASWVETLTHSLDQLVVPLRERLCRENREVFLSLVVSKVTEMLEGMIMKKGYNLLGAEQLDRDMRAVETYFAQQSQECTKGKFGRIYDITFLLTLEQVEEIVEMWNREEVDTRSRMRLSLSEIKRVLALRIGASHEEATRLELVGWRRDGVLM
ncbi:conserved oligomeric Golgi complex subunit 4-like [Schistocerca gregaria]|uniref:conserved oligomeric Golgi complex subunit 4-like n=1 Tax=Schistocerca gregaria TaxID=7010 RepID=UPI00211ED295|nr:conserved oligomeric Golgi complex subunit 4-like [Schistocerca gregaria]